MDALHHAKASLRSNAHHLIGESAKFVQSFISPDGMPFLHGRLHVDVRKATNLPDMESWIAKLVDKGDVTDPFVDIRIGRARLAKTSIVDNSLNPVWNESFRIELCHTGKHVVFEVRDKDHAYAEFIGSVKIDTDILLEGKVIEGEFPIRGRSGSHKGRLNLRICFVSAKSSTLDTYDVDDVYFSPKTGCSAKLYMDAHVYKNMPQFEKLHWPGTERVYEPHACWTDVYHSIMDAREVICITGWSVWDKLHLFRGKDKDEIESRNLGDILEDKANNGVKVYIMIWSEKTSGNVIGEKGMMGTHDMETYNRFKRTNVVCALTPREIDRTEFTDYLQNEFASGAYTHHQKTIVVDSDGSEGRRRLIAYVGGLDLTGGRWDTPDFPLFTTLMDEHYGDFRNSNAKTVPPEQGPREPWHDIHSRVEGPVAYDVYLNFYERWVRQAEAKQGPLPPLDGTRYDLNAPLQRADATWSVQLFRSITSDSAVFSPDKISNDCQSCALFSKKGRLVDASIARAYVQAIRNAKKFIYIENQYFLGSAFTWHSDADVNCHHILPVEIAQKIVDKIYAHERFTAYIVIPMFPEGDPQSVPIQAILYWQSMTVQMMYKRIADAIKSTKQVGSIHPTDYLVFLCPGRRDPPLTTEQQMHVDEPAEAMAVTFRQTMRFPIYVHSKMMIVDDAYIIVGSANINQRSIAGTRDTEIAAGMYQPEHVVTHENNLLPARGEVHMFRMALWCSHFKPASAEQVETFRNPDSPACLELVKQMALYNWRKYIGPIGSVTPGQMLRYPYDVSDEGKVSPPQDVPTFPDFGTGARIMGTKTKMIPEKVTT